MTLQCDHPKLDSVLAEISGVTKAFGSTVALNSVSLQVRPGEVHALLGENGAGKSTLVGVLAGLVVPDQGSVAVAGRSLRLGQPRAAVKAGVGLVQQHMALVEQLTGTQNFLLANPEGRFKLNRREASRLLADHGRRYGLQVDPRARVADLSIGERQRLELLIALSLEARILILDEPTTALTPDEVSILKRVLRTVAENGNAVIYISHKLPEITELADRVTVLRRGSFVNSYVRGQFDEARLVNDMMGDLPPKVRPQRLEPGRPVLSVKGLSAEGTGGGRGAVHELTLDVRSREIVGVAGVAGSGQEMLARLLAGHVRFHAGEFVIRPERVAFIPEDRHRDAIAGELPISDNAIVHRYRSPDLRRFGQLRSAAVQKFVTTLITDGGVYPARPELPAGRLSGGNQQKLVMARELDKDPHLIVVHNPYRGLDVRASLDVRSRLLEAKAAGAGVVLISTDLDDLFDLADLIVVLYEGRIVGSLATEDATVERLGRMMAGLS